MCLTAKKRLAEPCFFLFSNLGMGPFLSYVALKKKLSRFPFGHEPIFPAEIRTQMSLKGWRLFVFLVFIPVSSCKETLGPRLSPTSQVDQLQPFVSELRKALAQARANTVLDAMRCGEMMGNWWMDGVFFVGRFPTEKDDFWEMFLVDLMETQFKEHEKKPIRVAWISLRWFCVVWVNHLGSSKAASSVGCLFGTGMKLFNSIQSQKSSSSWHGEYTPEN